MFYELFAFFHKLYMLNHNISFVFVVLEIFLLMD